MIADEKRAIEGKAPSVGSAKDAPRLVIIAGVSGDGFIGKDGDLPWKLPADLAHFKKRTMGQALIMGRRTFVSIGRALPGRTTLVLSRGNPDLPPGVLKASSFAGALDQLRALESARTVAPQTTVPIETTTALTEIFVAGGEAVYAAALASAEVLELTRVHVDIKSGDARFPDWDREAWQCVSTKFRAADEKNVYAMTFERWERR